ncbi:TAXI family TRAP transporter solute-binding subunit [Paenibacillus sp. RC67]|uniref:TAXI family TRAP transporter solute-binding subunit n=1 Tax=Paenibacillus sp. RC67 TaxID=3039392 RepID=UPI0024AE7617|nr:TAXI family TRAP transporter solute-binding subunit [Paenibacillus sp. RC67]
MKFFNKRFMTASVLSLMLVATMGCGTKGDAKTPAAAPAAANAPSSTIPSNVKFATNTQGSAWYVYGASIAEMMRPVLKSSTIDVLPFSGGVGNATMLKDKKADIALSFSITSKWAYEGNIAYTDKQQDLRALVGSMDQYYVGLVASKSFVDKNGVKSIKDIADKKLPVRIYTNTKGSLAEFATRQVLEAYGLTYDTVKKFGGKVELTSNDVIQTAFQNGEADLHILVMPKGHPTISEIAVHTPIAFVPMENDVVDKFKKMGYQAATLPKDSYKGQTVDVPTIGFSSMILTTIGLNEELAYNITKTIMENKEKLVNAHDALKDFDTTKAMDPASINVPLHPGAEKYFKEKGLLK